MKKQAATLGLILSLGTSLLGVKAQSNPYVDEVYSAAAEYGVSGDWLYNTMICESGGDPSAYNYVTGDTGIMQFHPETFYAEGGQDINNPYEQIDLAARMFAEGKSYEWLCS